MSPMSSWGSGSLLRFGSLVENTILNPEAEAKTLNPTSFARRCAHEPHELRVPAAFRLDGCFWLRKPY